MPGMGLSFYARWALGGYVGRTLVSPAGPTALGRLWADATGRHLPERGFRMDQPTIHHGASELIKDLRGKEHQVRNWNGRSYTYTSLGRAYFDAAGNKARYIIEVPVLIEGRRGAGRDHRRDGEAYERRAMMPVSHFGVGEVQLSERLTSAQKEIRIKKMVLDSLGGQRRRRRDAAAPGVQRALALGPRP